MEERASPSPERVAEAYAAAAARVANGAPALTTLEQRYKVHRRALQAS